MENSQKKVLTGDFLLFLDFYFFWHAKKIRKISRILDTHNSSMESIGCINASMDLSEI